ncbi:MAG: Nif3-like dinuclear metal center hexameric protein [Desulfotomaculaceae bacterium]|nr:Nif3-like dinuclear metal center hexameric protein [Desulfotomaculaceae bacterium]
MPVKCRQIFNLMEELAPLKLAEDWDNSGLQVGDPNYEVSCVLLALDLDLNVAAEAKDLGAGLIISHHPLFFKPVKLIGLGCPQGELIYFLLLNQICAYAAHTNLDIANQGVSQALAERIGLQKLAVLLETGREAYYKIAVFVPEKHVNSVRRAMAEAGAGWIGNYSHCTFMTPGTGTFKPLEGANPYIGAKGVIEQVAEVKLETLVPEGRLSEVIRAMLEAHPYEEVAYDIYLLQNASPPYGLGRVGTLSEEWSFQQFTEMVKEALGLSIVRWGGNPGEKVTRVAVCGGSGADLWEAAKRSGADTFVTGDIKYHTAQQMLASGLKFIDPGHHGTEAVVLPMLQNYLQERCRQLKMDLQVLISQAKTDPFAYV